jgi:uncharacterized membrane protein YoaK (UPF0700 family)
MRRTHRVAADVDADTSARIEHSFLVVRVVRTSLLLLFLVGAAVAVELKDWPHGVTIVVAAAALLLAVRLGADVRRLSARGDRPPPASP